MASVPALTSSTPVSDSSAPSPTFTHHATLTINFTKEQIAALTELYDFVAQRTPKFLHMLVIPEQKIITCMHLAWLPSRGCRIGGIEPAPSPT